MGYREIADGLDEVGVMDVWIISWRVGSLRFGGDERRRGR